MSHLFVSYSHDDAVFAERLARDLKDAGFDVWIDFGGIPVGKEWETQIFSGVSSCDFLVICLTPAAVLSDWVRREVLMARSQHKPIIPILVKKQSEISTGIVETLKLLLEYEETRKLPDIQMVDFERFGYERSFQMLLEVLPSRVKVTLEPDPSTEKIDLAHIPNPFKGLEAFQQTDSHLFFGREALVQKLLQRLSDNRADRFLAVTGASGSGKSSLVRAGLIPKIRTSALKESGSWPLVIFAPGPLPNESLTQRLLPVIRSYGLPTAVLDVLKTRPEGLYVLTESLLNEGPRTARLVLVIDQFEEVFTRASASDASHFLDLLVTAATQPDGRTLIILTMRADFFDRLSNYPKLARLFEQENLVISTELAPDELRRSIEGPAGVVGLAYEHGLVDTILEDVRQQPGSLPLLQYALKQLYEARQGRWLKTSVYKTMGGVRGALAGHADAIYDNLSQTQKNLVRRLLVRLVEVSTTGEATRRRIDRDALTFRDVSRDDVVEIVQLLAAPDNRLLVSNREINATSQTAPVTVEISHEALVREWPKLRDWIKEGASELQYGSELLKDAQTWDKLGRNDPEYLLQGERRVLQAQLWLESADASDLQRDFILRSLSEAQKIKALKEQEQAEKLQLAQNAALSAQHAEQAESARATRFQNAARIAALVALVAVGVVIAALLATREANIRGNQAQNDLSTATVVLHQAISAQETAVIQVTAAQFSSTRIAFEGQRLSTLIPGLGQIPPTPATNIPPQEAFATATRIANAYGQDDDVIKVFDDGVEMVQVPAGCFYIGSRVGTDSVPVTYVCFRKSFWIDRFEVTNNQYQIQTGVTPPSDYKGDNQPVQRVNWFDASEYCKHKRDGARLPTEAEWTYAAAGPDSYAYPWGREFPKVNIEDYVVFNQQIPANVGPNLRRRGRSWVGAYDMSGNLSEWVDNSNKSNSYIANTGQEVDAEQYLGNDRVLMGGSSQETDEDNLHTFFHLRTDATDVDLSYGFRCARSSN